MELADIEFIISPGLVSNPDHPPMAHTGHKQGSHVAKKKQNLPTLINIVCRCHQNAPPTCNSVTSLGVDEKKLAGVLKIGPGVGLQSLGCDLRRLKKDTQVNKSLQTLP